MYDKTEDTMIDPPRVRRARLAQVIDHLRLALQEHDTGRREEEREAVPPLAETVFPIIFSPPPSYGMVPRGGTLALSVGTNYSTEAHYVVLLNPQNLSERWSNEYRVNFFGGGFGFGVIPTNTIPPAATTVVVRVFGASGVVSTYQHTCGVAP